jgi:hypothetical protein
VGAAVLFGGVHGTRRRKPRRSRPSSTGASDGAGTAIWRAGLARGRVAGMEERTFDDDDAKLLFEVLFDIKALLAGLVDYVVGGDDDGEEEEEVDEP